MCVCVYIGMYVCMSIGGVYLAYLHTCVHTFVSTSSYAVFVSLPLHLHLHPIPISISFLPSFLCSFSRAPSSHAAGAGEPDERPLEGLADDGGAVLLGRRNHGRTHDQSQARHGVRTGEETQSCTEECVGVRI